MTETWTFFFVSSELSTEGIALTCLCVPVNKCFFVVILWFHGPRPHWLSELGVLEAHPLGCCFKCWGAIGGTKHFAIQGEPGSYPSLYEAVLGIGFMASMSLNLSHLFPLEYFIICLIYRRLWLVLISFRGNLFMYTIFGVYMGGGEFRRSLFHHLGQPIRACFKLLHPFDNWRPLSFSPLKKNGFKCTEQHD